jgi:integrase
MGWGVGVRIHRLSANYRQCGVAPGLKKQLHPDGGGVYLQAQISPSGETARSWLLRYTLLGSGGRVREMGLGGIADTSLAQAREAAAKWRKIAKQGLDPIEVRDAEIAGNIARRRAAVTVDQAARDYIVKHSPDWANEAHRRQWTQSLRDYVSPVIGRTPVADVDTPDVLRVLSPIWLAKPATARRVRSRLEAILGFAETAGWRPPGANPARWPHHLANLLPKKKPAPVHLAALPHAEVAAFMADLRQRPQTAPVLALRFLILAAVRWSDVRLAKAADIDRARKVWAIPAFSKTRAPHTVPLSTEALAIADAALAGRTDDGPLFRDEAGRPLWDHAARDAIREAGYAGKITAHGFRSSFRDWALEATTFPAELAELSLGHTVGDATIRAYRRGEALERRFAIMEAWATYLAEPTKGATVTPLRRRKAAGVR